MGVATSVGGPGSPSSATALPSVIAGERGEMMPATELAAWGLAHSVLLRLADRTGGPVPATLSARRGRLHRSRPHGHARARCIHAAEGVAARLDGRADGIDGGELPVAICADVRYPRAASRRIDGFRGEQQMSTAALLLFATGYPAFAYVVSHVSVPALFALVAWLALLEAIYFGALPALMSEIFPVSTRATGMSIGYNIGVTVFGGFTPAIIIWLLSATGSKAAPSFYMMFTAVISLAALAAVSRGKGGTRALRVAA